MTTKKAVPRKHYSGFFDGFWDMAINETWKLIAILVTITLCIVFLYGTFDLGWFKKQPIKVPILEQKGSVQHKVR